MLVDSLNVRTTDKSEAFIDSGLENISNILELKCKFSKQIIENLIKKQCNFPNINEIIKNQTIIDSLKDKILDFDEYYSNEQDLEFFFENSADKTLEEDTFGQLIFQHNDLKIFNSIPFLLLFLSHFKIFFIPLLSVAMPILAYFLPYLLVKYVWKMPMSFSMYQGIMGKMWSFSFESPQKILQNVFTIFTFLQSMYQPIQNGLHLYTIDSTIKTLGLSIYKYFNTVNNIKDKVYNIYNISSHYDFEKYDVRRNFIFILENPNYLKIIYSEIAKLEILYKISKKSIFKQVSLYSSITPYFKGKEIYDINLSNPITSDFDINESNNHYLLTGPNGGGKSSFLRAVLQTILLGQTFGYALGESVELSPFDYIFSGLHIQDIPGKKSLFEKEICFARDVLYCNNPDFKGLVLFDEIFHSTNPNDSIRSSNKFLNTIWSYKHMSSIVSSHVFEIIEQSPDFVKKICLGATRKNNELIYNYKLSNGICKESSVDKIWVKEFSAD